METQHAPVEVFYSCSDSPTDAPLLEQLESHLSALQREGLIATWHKRQIVAGSVRQVELDYHLNTASLILLLISSDFLASDYCYGTEMQRALQRHSAKEALVVPILLRSCVWQSAPFAALEMLPTGAKPITMWHDRDDAWTDVVMGIRRMLSGKPGVEVQDLPVSQGAVSVDLQQVPIWNVPFARNPFFTGRDDLLEQLHTQLQTMPTEALGQPQVISGLGGIGKTQMAVEYAYRYYDEYRYVLWARAESIDALGTSFTEIARLLNLPEKNAPGQEITIQAVKRWLQWQRDWLLILDNADSPGLLSDFLPPVVGSHLLITTRAADVSAHIADLVHPLIMDPFSEEQGALFLLHRSGLLALDAPLEQAEMQTRQLAGEIAHELGGLPLALDQAGAYLKVTRCSLAVYQHLYQERRAQLLGERRSVDHPDSVATTWNLSFEHVEQQNPAASDLLRLCAFLAPDVIPEEIITQGAETLGPLLAPVAADAYLFNQAIEALHTYSLVTRDPDEQTLAVHRLVQAVLQDVMKQEEQSKWAERAVRVVEQSFPYAVEEHLFACQWYLSHALLCSEHIKQWNMIFPEARDLLFRVGYYFYQRVQYADAEPLWKYSLAMSEQMFGPDHHETASGLNTLANLLTFQHKYEQAEPLYRRALEITERTFGANHLNTAMTIQNLGLWYKEQGKYEQAEHLYQRALAIYEREAGPDHPYTVMMIQNIATLYADQGKDEQAELLYQRALMISEQAPGPNHPNTALICYNLATIYENQGKDEQAEQLYQRALTMRENTLGLDHIATMQSLQKLISFYVDQRNYEQADLLYQRYERADLLYQQTPTIGEQMPEPDHLDVAKGFHDLAIHYARLGKYERAESLYQRALAIYEREAGSDHPNTAASLYNLAELYLEQGDYEQAELLYQRALVIYERALGLDHSHTIDSFNRLVALYLIQGKEREVELLYAHILEIEEQELGIDHPTTIISLYNLADFYQDRRRYSKAEALYQRALVVHEQASGKSHPYTAQCLSRLAELYRAQEKYEEAEPLAKRALAIYEQALDANHPYVAASLNNLADLYLKQGKYAQAKPLLKRALAIYKRQRGKDHPDTQTVRANYTFVLKAMRRDKLNL